MYDKNRKFVTKEKNFSKREETSCRDDDSIARHKRYVGQHMPCGEISKKTKTQAERAEPDRNELKGNSQKKKDTEARRHTEF